MKDLSDLQRNVYVARGRGISHAQVMEQDLLSTNILFDGDYTSKPDDKSVLVRESSNEEKVQDLCRSSFTRLAIEAGIQLVLSEYVSGEDKITDCTRISSDMKSVIVPEMNSKSKKLIKYWFRTSTIQLAKVPNDQ